MIEIRIPGRRELCLEHLVLDYNGTLALDGNLISGVSPLLVRLAESLQIHVITADTFGSVKAALTGAPVIVSTIPRSNEDQAKADYVQRLGTQATAAIGNGRNDHLMLKQCVVGIAVFQQEGASMQAIGAADIVIPSIVDGLGLLLHPDRLIATLRC